MSEAIAEKLALAQLRPTQQRILLAQWMFSGPHKHFTAEDMHKNMLDHNANVSLATIYNTLSAFVSAGLLKTVNIEAGRMFYDTNTGPHYHIYDEARGLLSDIDISAINLSQIPPLPDGHIIDRVDITIRTRSNEPKS